MQRPWGHVASLSASTVAANDAAVNFGQYDNDGPDGLPNSGDDDGFVDFVAFVHPERGAECGTNGNIWSHRFSLSGWLAAYGEGTGLYTTNDARTGGGFIKVDDYTIQPVLNCNNFSLIDIGVFCHEFGHAFGLPDLYDTDGGSQGVGHLVPDGQRQLEHADQSGTHERVVEGPAGLGERRPCPADADAVHVFDVETNRDVYRLDVMHEKWRRRSECALTGTISMQLRADRGRSGESQLGSGGPATATTGTRPCRGSSTTAARAASRCSTSTRSIRAVLRLRVRPHHEGGVTTDFAVYDGTGRGHGRTST